ncbi:hypothetical protein P3S68_026571 [Capsicum galapagoense]
MSSGNTKNNVVILICFISLVISCFFEVSNATKYIKFPPPLNVGTKKQPKIPANPYTRGCSPLTRCRGGKSNRARVVAPNSSLLLGSSHEKQVLQ